MHRFVPESRFTVTNNPDGRFTPKIRHHIKSLHTLHQKHKHHPTKHHSRAKHHSEIILQAKIFKANL